MDDAPLYESENVSDLILRGKRERTVRTLNIFIFEIVLLIIIVYVIRIYGLMIYLIALFTIFPYPFIKIPEEYKITIRGVVFQENHLIPIKSEYRLQVNSDGNFVSISHRRRGEFLRLYTNEPEKVYTILQNLTSSQNN